MSIKPDLRKAMSMKRCVIFGGAPIGDYDRMAAYIADDDYLIFCDSGLRHARPLGLTPDLIVGDFDSCENPGLQVETIVLPRAKDDTDTVYAAKEAMKRGYTEFLLAGVIGGRFDHSAGNVSILLMLHCWRCWVQIGKSKVFAI